MNYYEFLYRWTYSDEFDVIFFDCSGFRCCECPFEYFAERNVACRKLVVAESWSQLLFSANQLLKKGWLHK